MFPQTSLYFFHEQSNNSASICIFLSLSVSLSSPLSRSCLFIIFPSSWNSFFEFFLIFYFSSPLQELQSEEMVGYISSSVSKWSIVKLRRGQISELRVFHYCRLTSNIIFISFSVTLLFLSKTLNILFSYLSLFLYLSLISTFHTHSLSFICFRTAHLYCCRWRRLSHPDWFVSLPVKMILNSLPVTFNLFTRHNLDFLTPRRGSVREKVLIATEKQAAKRGSQCT